ncbi:prenyltransferase/squalene oxidase repeat-containing protein [Cytobacillus solani]|uniref:Squalene-hopene cyclase n=1 Tax=Cytobacillus solani TaxID=1637975 RepID=A0A0Q3SQV8_9BACI|nr:prenyltransferase/squalene oxidase repeat-containing protein [Cytobacillus solani]KOP83978.1 squalene-hopene cyclase [Bacillus sp. FJAT-21945]KQL21916.1 squalene-hopene cyclase [Cytobacillus solani]USK57565.1 squalene--hopene cyclase [Cytobacillus solani]
MKSRISAGINQLIEKLQQDQSPNGSWDYPFETGISTDCYMIILLRTLEIHDEILIKQLTDRIISKQEKTGAWKLYYDEGEGNITATAEAYYALLYSGYYRKQDLRLKKARQYILANGGLDNVHLLTKLMLAMTGQLKWPARFPLPIELILLPPTFPINFYSFSVFGRANMAPIMILADRKYCLRSKDSPDLSDLLTRKHDHSDNDSVHFHNTEEWRSLYETIEKGIKCLIGLPSYIHKLATEQTKQYMLARIEPNGTFLGYFSSTFLMIFALLSLGYSKKDPIIIKAVKGLKSMKCEINGQTHIQYTNAAVWNTSLISYAIQEAGLSTKKQMLERANNYLLSQQHYKYGDWIIHNPSSFPGGWGFSDNNTLHPDVDDTTASLRAIARNVQNAPNYRQSWDRGVMWALSMQNDDGGWPAFEKNTNSRLVKMLPIDKAEFLLTDPSSADLTGRTLEFLCSCTNLSKNHEAIKNGMNWLLRNQEKDGSWYGRWGICYIYGTWAAITGLRSAAVGETHHSVRAASVWLLSIQNPDGGWGESCKSDSKQSYIPLKASTLTHTAWAVDALIAVSDKPTKAINAGINYLLNHLHHKDWTTDYPKGQGMAGDFYIHYHSYRFIFSLLALAHYQNKYHTRQ